MLKYKIEKNQEMENIRKKRFSKDEQAELRSPTSN